MVMIETMVTPGATSIVTSAFTAPRSILRITPARVLRALSFIDPSGRAFIALWLPDATPVRRSGPPASPCREARRPQHNRAHVLDRGSHEKTVGISSQRGDPQRLTSAPPRFWAHCADAKSYSLRLRRDDAVGAHAHERSRACRNCTHHRLEPRHRARVRQGV